MTAPAAPAAPPRLDGAPNFRAVAPLPTAHGRRLRAARLWRSDALHRLTDADLDALAALRIGAVLDLRREDERTQMPTRWPAAAPRDTLVFDDVPDRLQAVRAGGWRLALDGPDFHAEGARRWMVETYGRMPAALAPAVLAAARRLAGTDREPVPVLVHCTAGKDRTGFVVAMLLAAVGVPRDAIVDDYLESARRTPPADLARRLVERAGLRPAPRELEAIETIADVRVEYLEAALAELGRTHGSIDAYLEATGVDGALRAALRDALLD